MSNGIEGIEGIKGRKLRREVTTHYYEDLFK